MHSRINPIQWPKKPSPHSLMPIMGGARTVEDPWWISHQNRDRSCVLVLQTPRDHCAVLNRSWVLSHCRIWKGDHLDVEPHGRDGYQAKWSIHSTHQQSISNTGYQKSQTPQLHETTRPQILLVAQHGGMQYHNPHLHAHRSDAFWYPDKSSV